MRKFFLFLGTIVLLWLGASFIVGGMARDQYLNFLKTQTSGSLTLTNVRYDRGLFSSTALTRAALIDPGKGSGKEFAVLLEHVLRHGPLPLGVKGEIRPALAQMETFPVDASLQPEAAGKILTAVPALEQTRATTWFDFQGQADCVMQTPIITMVDAEKNTSFTADAGTLRFQYNPSGPTLDGELNLPELQMQDENGKFYLHGLHGRFDLLESLPRLYVGKVATVLDRVDIETSAFFPVSLTGLRFSSDSGIEGNRLFYLQNATLDSLRAGEKTYGPIVFDIALRNLDAHSVSEFQSRMQSMYGQSGGVTETRLNMLKKEFVDKLLAGNPEFEISRFSISTDEGDLESRLGIRLAGTGSVTLTNPFLLLQRLEIRADVSVKEDLARYAATMAFASGLVGGRTTSDQFYEEQIGALLEKELLIRDGDRLKSNATLLQGRLRVNGKDMSLF